MSLRIGETFAGYRIVRLLGSGGMGEVYLAQHPRLPKHNALKILPASTSSDGGFRERFAREADLAATLYHPHIVGVHDRGENDGQLWIAMDFVDGTDAARLLRDYGGGLPLPRVLDVLDAVADALDFAHYRRLLHRDVKPANVLLTSSAAGKPRVLLADFGIARHADEVSGLTSTNMAVGTVTYAAPEQLMGEALDGRADQYALAATAYHLLAGRPPYVHANPAVIIGKHLNASPPALSETRPELRHLDAAFAKALSKEPADRYENCVSFANAIRELVERVALDVEPTRPAPSVGRSSLERHAAPAIGLHFPPTGKVAADGETSGTSSPLPAVTGSSHTARGVVVLLAVIAVVVVIAVWATMLGTGDRGTKASPSTAPATPTPTAPTTPVDLPRLPAPSPESPADGAVFSNYPRHVELSWTPQPGAVGYIVEVQWQESDGHWTTWRYENVVNPHYRFDFRGSPNGRWMVTSVDANGEHGQPMPWQAFSYMG